MHINRVAWSDPGTADKCVPNSGGPEFGKHWSLKTDKRQEPDIVKICDYWIRSEKPKLETDDPAKRA